MSHKMWHITDLGRATGAVASVVVENHFSGCRNATDLCIVKSKAYKIAARRIFHRSASPIERGFVTNCYQSNERIRTEKHHLGWHELCRIRVLVDL